MHKRVCVYTKGFFLYGIKSYVIIPSLTVKKNKIAVTLVNMGVTAIFCSVTDYSNLFFAFTFFLNSFHLTFRYKLKVCTETTGFM